MKKLSVIIINYGTAEMTERVIRNFFAMEKDLDYEIILIDNKSEEELPRERFLDLGVKVIENKKNLGFAKAVNRGLKMGRGEYFLLLNSDVFITKGAISKMLEYLKKNSEIGLIGPRMIFPSGRLQPSFGKFPNLWREFLRLFSLNKIFSGSTVERDTIFKKVSLKNERRVDWLTGGCLLGRQRLVRQIGYLDENYFLGVEDIDFCYRARKAGWKSVYYPQARVFHHHGASSGADGTRSILRLRADRDGFDYFFKKHFPRARFRRLILRVMHNLKIFIIKFQNIYKKQKAYKPKDATIAVTYDCNSRCRMCNIWQAKKGIEIPLKAFYNLSPNLRYINLSGGEPFLRDDLPEIVKIIKQVCPSAQIIISTNGLATEKIITAAREILAIDPGVGIRVSLDGIGQTHDKVRGIKGMYKNVWQTIDGLKYIGVDNLGVSFTVMDYNAGELREVYELARKNNLQFALALVQNSEIYFNKQNNQSASLAMIKSGLDYVINSELTSRNPKQWLRAYYDHGLKYYAEHGKRPLSSGAGFDSLFIDARGDIFPSNLINLKLGNIIDNKLDDIWRSGQAKKARHKIKQENITENWIICTIRGEMKKHPLKIILWVIKNKSKLLFLSSSKKALSLMPNIFNKKLNENTANQ